MATKKAIVEAKTESLLPPGPETESKQPEAVEETETKAPEAESQAPQDVEDASAEDEDSAPIAEDAKAAPQEDEDESAEAPEAPDEAKTPEATEEAEAEDSKPNNAQPIIYAGVILARNKTRNPICLSPIQLGIYATLTIQSGEIVALPHKYARSLISQNCFEEVKAQLYVIPCADCKSASKDAL